MSRALFIEEKGPEPAVSLRDLRDADLPEGELLVDVLWSSINYKDALALTGRSPIVRGRFPFVPGIDLAGRVTHSESPDYVPGDLVIQTGWGLGETRFGGLAERARVRADHVVPLPSGLRPRDTMVIGTAGFTAMLACLALEHHGLGSGPIVVTGASGGVGSFAVALLSRLGHEVVASTGSGADEYLSALGASRVMDRDELGRGAKRPLDSGRWGGAVDSVGGTTLEALISQVSTRGAVAVCGLAGSSQMNTTVFPFILRGLGLLGIDSNTCPHSLRLKAWARLADLVDDALLDSMVTEVGLPDAPKQARKLLEKGVRGRTVVRCLG